MPLTGAPDWQRTGRCMYTDLVLPRGFARPGSAGTGHPLAILAFLLPTLLGAGCDVGGLFESDEITSSTFGASGVNRDPDTLIVARPLDAISLDPARPSDNESVEVIDQIFEKLVQYRAGSTEPEPGLATDWQVTDQGRVWTFHLRQGVEFHDGTPFDADAVVFSLERQRDPMHPFHTGKFSYWENVYRNIEKVEKVDDFTVRITIERSYAPFLANMGMFPVAIVSPTAVEKYGADFANHPVGTGPFRFVSWQPGDRIVLERNEDYWGGAPPFKRLVFQVIPDPRQRLVGLESGGIDIAYQILPESLQFVELHPALVLHKIPANNVAYLAFNTTHPPFDDPDVRRAANYAVNKEPIVKLVYQGNAIPAHGPLPPTQWGYHDVGERYPYDPVHARQLLAEAAAAGRFDPERTLSFYVPSAPRPYLPKPEVIARVLQTNLADVGIKTRIVLKDFETLLNLTQRGEHDLCLFGWVGDNGDPDNFLYTLFDRDNTVPGLARNIAFFRDPEVHGLLVMAQESDSREEREVLYARAQDLIAQEAPWVPIAHSKIAVAARADIGGVTINQQSHIYYRTVRRIKR